MAAAGDNSSHGLLFGAGTLLTVAFITITVLVFNTAQDGAKTATAKFSTVNTELSQAEYITYDSSTVSGSTVMNAIRKYANGNVPFGVSVQTGKASTSVWYGKEISAIGDIGGTGGGSMQDAINETSANYINPNGSFTSSVVKDQNNMVRAIKFIQK